MKAMHMNTKRRINECRLIEKMDTKERYCEELGIENVSTFRGKLISKMEVTIDDPHNDRPCHTDTYAMDRI